MNLKLTTKTVIYIFYYEVANQSLLQMFNYNYIN